MSQLGNSRRNRRIRRTSTVNATEKVVVKLNDGELRKFLSGDPDSRSDEVYLLQDVVKIPETIMLEPEELKLSSSLWNGSGAMKAEAKPSSSKAAVEATVVKQKQIAGTSGNQKCGKRAAYPPVERVSRTPNGHATGTPQEKSAKNKTNGGDAAIVRAADLKQPPLSLYELLMAHFGLEFPETLPSPAPKLQFESEDNAKRFFRCYPLETQEEFEWFVYFVNIHSPNVVAERDFRAVVENFDSLLGNWKFLPDRKIVTTRPLPETNSDAFRTRITLNGLPVKCSVQFLLLQHITKGLMTNKVTDVIHHVITDIMRNEGKVWHIGQRYFVWTEERIVEPGAPFHDFLCTGFGLRLSVGQERGRPYLMMEPFIYLRDTRGVLNKLYRTFPTAAMEDSLEIPEMNIFTRHDRRSHKVDKICFNKNPMSTVTSNGVLSTYADFYKSRGWGLIEYLYQPMLTKTEVEYVGHGPATPMFVPELCDEFKLKMVTDADLKTEALSVIIGTKMEWEHRMNVFANVIQRQFQARFDAWKVSIARTPAKVMAFPLCQVKDDVDWTN